jgi:hypothetical protein
MGKPSPAQDGKIRYDFTSAVAGLEWPAGQLEARVNAVGPEGAAASDVSNPFTFSAGSGCAVTLGTSTIQALAAGGQYAIGVSTGSGCRWAASTSQSWLVLSTASGTGSGTLPVSVRASSSTSSRTGLIYVGGQTLTVWQAAGATGSSANVPVLSWPTPLPITQGTPLSSLQLNATASVPGTFTYNPPAGTVLPAGSHSLSATFSPDDTVLYSTATAFTTLSVNPAAYRLTVTRPSGGLVYGAGIECGTAAATCQVTMPGSMSLGLQAVPDAGYRFGGWTGDCSGTDAAYSLLLGGSRTCGARFDAVAPPSPSGTPSAPPPGGEDLPIGAPYTLTALRPTGGTVYAAGIDCGTNTASCTVTMPGPMNLGLQAAPDSGYVFVSWTGHCSGTQAAYALALEGPRTCGATFAVAR